MYFQVKIILKNNHNQTLNQTLKFTLVRLKIKFTSLATVIGLLIS